MSTCRMLAASAAVVLLAAGCGGAGHDASPTVHALSADTAAASENAMRVAVSVLSSPPQYVSGGDARIAVRAAPGLRDKLEIWVNGSPAPAALKQRGDGLEGVVS